MHLHTNKVGPDEVESLHEILRLCGLDMQARFGLAHWIPAYPLELMRRDAEQKSVYAVLDGERTGATFTVGTQPPFYYDPVLSELPNAKAMYLNRLAVLPEMQGRGIGTWCMQIIERLAVENACSVLRFDAYDKHLKLLDFYRGLGYQERGSRTFNTPRRGETGAVFFEKMLG
jgi:GNAT superfamily N-acetyltransferase